MRQLARLVLKICEIDQPITLDQCIDRNKMFDVVVEAIWRPLRLQKQWVEYPWQKACHLDCTLHIVSSSDVISNDPGIAIRLGDQRMRNDLKDLYESEWTGKISGPALQSLKERVYRKETLPISADLRKCSEFTEEAISRGKDCLLVNPCISKRYYEWRRAAAELIIGWHRTLRKWKFSKWTSNWFLETHIMR